MAGLTPTAERMLESLPAYYHGNLFVEQVILLPVANEIDRIGGHADAVRAGLVPGLADDEYGLLSAWEGIMGLPVAPAGVAVAQRQAKLVARFRAIGDGSSRNTMATLREAARGANVIVLENTPARLIDTIRIPFAEPSYEAGQLRELAAKIWPAHRDFVFDYPGGFILGVSSMGDLL